MGDVDNGRMCLIGRYCAEILAVSVDENFMGIHDNTLLWSKASTQCDIERSFKTRDYPGAS